MASLVVTGMTLVNSRKSTMAPLVVAGMYDVIILLFLPLVGATGKGNHRGRRRTPMRSVSHRSPCCLL